MAETAAPQRAPEIDARLALVYERYATSLRKRCLRLTRDPVAADDLMQEVLTRFLAKFARPPAGMNVHAYLLAMAHNVWLNQVRHENALPVGELDDAHTADDRIENDPVRALLLGEQRNIVRRGAAGLPGRQRRALTLRELDGRSYAEIGAELGIGTNAVAQIVWRARGQLRRAVRRSQVDADGLPEACRAMLDDMSELLESVEGRRSPALEAHLADCRSCRSTLASYQEAGSRLRGALPLLPLAAMLTRAATVLRTCVEATPSVGTAAVVTAAVVTVGGGGGAVLATHARASHDTARAARRLALPAKPAAVTGKHLRARSAKPLVLVRSVHARPWARAHGPRLERHARRRVQRTRPEIAAAPLGIHVLAAPAATPGPSVSSPDAAHGHEPATDAAPPEQVTEPPAVETAPAPAAVPASPKTPSLKGASAPSSEGTHDTTSTKQLEKAAKTPSTEHAPTVQGEPDKAAGKVDKAEKVDKAAKPGKTDTADTVEQAGQGSQASSAFPPSSAAVEPPPAAASVAPPAPGPAGTPPAATPTTAHGKEVTAEAPPPAIPAPATAAPTPVLPAVPADQPADAAPSETPNPVAPGPGRSGHGGADQNQQ